MLTSLGCDGLLKGVLL